MRIDVKYFSVSLKNYSVRGQRTHSSFTIYNLSNFIHIYYVILVNLSYTKPEYDGHQFDTKFL